MDGLYRCKEMKFLIASVVLGYGVQKMVWAFMDWRGLRQYGPNGWPYPLNPSVEAIYGIAAILVSLWLMRRSSMVAMGIAFLAAIAAGVRFWIERWPADPYTDYGEDNFESMFVTLFYIAILLTPIAIFERRWSKLPEKLADQDALSNGG